MSFALFTSRKKREEALRKSSGARERRQNLDTSIGWLLLLQVVLIALNAVFACAEIAVLSVNEVKLSKMVSEGNRKAKRLSRLTAQPARFLATIQVAITLAGFLGSAFAAENFSDPLVDWLVGLGVTIPPATLNTLAVILITLILSFFTLVFGELVPKRIAMKQSEKVALNISGLITVISKLFAPIVWLLSASTNGILRLLGIVLVLILRLLAVEIVVGGVAALGLLTECHNCSLPRLRITVRDFSDYFMNIPYQYDGIGTNPDFIHQRTLRRRFLRIPCRHATASPLHHIRNNAHI